MLDLNIGAFVTALLVTVVEMTEVVALVFALAADHDTVRHGALGAAGGTAFIGVLALSVGFFLIRLPDNLLLWAATLVLFGFGLFLLRSTRRTYRRQRLRAGGAPAPASHAGLQFAGGFSIGAVEATETVVVLLALAAGGAWFSAVLGAAVGGAVLVGVASVLHERVRRVKVPALKLGATSLLFAFAVFWAGEAARYPWPGADLILLPLFLVALVLVRGIIGLDARGPVPVPVEPKG